MYRSATLDREEWISILNLLIDEMKRNKNNDYKKELFDVYKKIYGQTIVYEIVD